MKTARDICTLIRFEMLQIKCTSLHCPRCSNKVSCEMHAIAYDMILGGVS